ncbi:MAG: adenosine deaminase [Pseudomonadota bacterium]
MSSTRPHSKQQARRLLTAIAVLILGLTGQARAEGAGDWFERVKSEATPDQLYRFLYAMPKGGDLHNHITGSVHSEWYLEEALAAAQYGYRYFTKVRINNCRYTRGEGPVSYFLLYRNITAAQHAALDACEQAEYKPLTELAGDERVRWLNSIRLDKAYEGRNEFFETHWQRIDALGANPYLVAEILVRNMKAFGAEGLSYLEAQVPVFGFQTPSGESIEPQAVIDLYTERLEEADALESGVTVRLQVSLLRFLPNAEQQLEVLYRLAAANDLLVAVNMVGREDNDKGYPLRFLKTLRSLRQRLHGVRLSIHAGEVDEPNEHVRDTLLLGADRIGHGVNLITDPDTLLLFRHGPYLVEINLISNLLLEYVQQYSQHPFPEYLRIGVPVALSTDDRGMWDSTMTDEFYVAVTEFNLSWEEVKQLSRNSLSYSFLEEPVKAAVLDSWTKRIERFETLAASQGVDAFAGVEPQYRGFICRRYKICAPPDDTAASRTAVESAVSAETEAPAETSGAKAS